MAELPENTRQKKVAREVQRDLAEIILSRGMAAFDGAMVTVSGVKMSPDLSLAKVYVSIFPSTKAEKVMELLDENNRLVRSSSLLNREITVNYVVDRRGQVTQAWILTDAEKKEKRPGFGVERNFRFESDATAPDARTLPAQRPASPEM